MRIAALAVLSLASLASGLFTAKAGGAAELVDCSVCFANETLDVTELGPANNTEAEEEAEAKQGRRSNQSTQIMVVGGLTGGFVVAAICRRPRRPRKAASRWTQTPTQTSLPPPQERQHPRTRKLSTHWLAPHTYLPPSGHRKQQNAATVEQGMQTLPPPRSYRSMVKVTPWQRPSSAPVTPQGAPGGSGQLDTLKKRPAHLTASKAADFTAVGHPGMRRDRRRSQWRRGMRWRR